MKFVAFDDLERDLAMGRDVLQLEKTNPGAYLPVDYATLKRLMAIVGHARDVCLHNGHVKTGVGDMNRCSRCGEIVSDAEMRESVRRGRP